jgi:hypothetical protein
MRKLILALASLPAPVLVAAPAADAPTYSRLFAEESNPIAVCGYTARQSS